MSREERARTLEVEARLHKRQIRHHRAELRRCREALADLRAECERLGIGLEIHEGEGADPHGRNGK